MKVYLLTGFNNWGKSSLIEEMFNGKKRFHNDKLYSYSGKKFCIQSQSNDDLGRKGYENKVLGRLRKLKEKNIVPSHILTAFCPTKEPENLSAEIIENLYKNCEVHIILIQYKWCLHAELRIEEIREYFSKLRNVKVHILSEPDCSKKKISLDSLMLPLL